MSSFSTEIRTFYSLKEIRENIDEELNKHRMLLEDYGEWLGTLLRNPESSKKQGASKKTAELQKLMKSGRKKGEKKKGRSDASEWGQFKDLMLSSDDFGEAEILFEATEELKKKIDRLEKAKSSVLDLERYGLGKDLIFITYIHDGVPERIVFKLRAVSSDTDERFKFTADFEIAETT